MQNKKIMLVGIIALILIGGAVLFWKKDYLGMKNVKGEYKKSEQAKVQVKNDKVEAPKTKAPDAPSNSFADLNGTKIIYYYSNACSHCKAVLAFMDKNNIYSKVEFIKKEITTDRNNSKELSEAASKCGLDPAKIGVPFVYDNGKCFMGDTDIIKLFSEKAGIEQ